MKQLGFEGVVALIACAVALLWPRSAPEYPGLYYVKAGMSAREVKALLGEPQNIQPKGFLGTVPTPPERNFGFSLLTRELGRSKPFELWMYYYESYSRTIFFFVCLAPDSPTDSEFKVVDTKRIERELGWKVSLWRSLPTWLRW